MSLSKEIDKLFEELLNKDNSFTAKNDFDFLALFIVFICSG